MLLLPRPHSLFVCGVFVTHYKDKINKVMWAFAGDALTDAYLEQAALVVDYRQGVGIGEAYGDQSMPVNPGDSLYTVLFSTPDAVSLRVEEQAVASKLPLKLCEITRM